MTERPPDPKAQRAADIERLRCHMPVAMRERAQWLLWKFIQKPGGGKPAKVPFYVSGQPRGWPRGKPSDGVPSLQHPQVEQGHPLDRATLTTFDEALKRLQSAQHMAGIGFAFLPGDGLMGIDIDGAIDRETGEVSAFCQDIIARCPSYTELSVSGTGVHIILEGHTPKFKDDLIGLEVYCDSQYFTCTGTHWAGSPAEVLPADRDAVTYMRTMVERSLEAQRIEREAAAALKHAAADGQAGKAKPKLAAVAGAPVPEKGKDFKAVNDAAMAALHAWVPALFPGAKPHTSEKGQGYRVTSKALGRDLQEDLTITPGGIRDFGTRQGMSPIDLVVEFGGHSLKDALAWLAPLVGVTLSKPRPRLRSVPPPDDAGPAGADERPDPPALENAVDARALGGREAAKSSSSREAKQQASSDDDGDGGSGRRRRPVNPQVLNRLFENFAYQYGSEIAWDVERRKAYKISHLKHTFGNDAVRIWMNHDDRRMVQEEEVVFEPGGKVGPNCINLYGGLPLVPEPGDCSVMIELLRHLCSETEAPGMSSDEVADWVLRWCALPLQRPGTKLDTALVFHGAQGTGKNLFFDAYRRLYGEYGVMVGQTELDEKYNTWLSKKMLIIGDEVASRQELYHVKNRLKWIITATDPIPIRAMNMDTRWETNHANLAFLSNESQPLLLEDNDRRMFVAYTPLAERGDLYARVREFLDAGGAAKFLHHLLHIPLDDFNRHSKPPLTNAKANLIELGLKPAQRFMHEWIQGFLPLPMRVCSVEQLYRAFRRWADVNGERFPPKQADFTDQARRFARERVELDASGEVMAPVLEKREVQVRDVGAPNGRKLHRIWIPRGCGPVGDDTWGSFALSAIDEFEKVTWGFLRRRHEEDDDVRG